MSVFDGALAKSALTLTSTVSDAFTGDAHGSWLELHLHWPATLITSLCLSISSLGRLPFHQHTPTTLARFIFHLSAASISLDLTSRIDELFGGGD